MVFVLKVIVPINGICGSSVEIGTKRNHSIYFAINSYFELCLIGSVGTTDIPIDYYSTAMKFKGVLSCLFCTEILYS